MQSADAPRECKYVSIAPSSTQKLSDLHLESFTHFLNDLCAGMMNLLSEGDSS